MRFLIKAAATTTLLLAVGCGYDGIPLSGSPTTTPASTSNNWELVTTATTAGSSQIPLSDLSGSILEQSGSGSSHRATAVFQATAGCYANAEVVPFDGSIMGSTFQARSFDVRGQYLTINGTLDATGSQMTGSYQIGGGCANGESGTFIGTRYRALTGSYIGTFSNAGVDSTLSLIITQSADPTGQGSFILSGSGTATGLTCFHAGTIPIQGGYISGSKAFLSLTDNGNSGGQLVLNGIIDSGATSITVSQLQVVDGSCAGNYGAVKLQRQ